MKKKLFITLLSLVCAVCCLFGLVACNGGKDNNNPNGEDKVKQNAEFVEYRRKVVAVLKDNGIFVNDYDSDTSLKKSAVMKSYAVAVSWQEDKNTVKNLLVKGDNLQNSEDYSNMQNQIYAISFRMSLMIGDGISSYFNEKRFYGITVNLRDNLYMKVIKDGDVTITQFCERDITGDRNDLFMNISLDFKSENDYEYTCIQWYSGSDEIFFAYGNSEKELLMVNGDTDVVYSPDALNFYSTTEKSVIAECIQQVKYAKPDHDNDFIALKNEVRYTLSNEQTDALFEKYFKDVVSSAEGQRGSSSITIAEKTVAINYLAMDGETTVEIPYGTDYISEDFYVRDKLGTVKKIAIPNTVKGVVRTNNPETGDLYTEIVTIDPEMLRLVLEVGDKDVRQRLFESIIVEEGSPLFNAGNGNLYTKSGILIYLVNSPLENFDISIFSDKVLSDIIEDKYTRLFDKIYDFSLDLNGDYSSIVRILPKMKALTTLNLIGDFTQSSHIEPLNITVNRPLTVNCDFVCDMEPYGSPLPNINFIAGNADTATLNLKGASRVDTIYSDNVNVTVNIELPEELFDLYEIRKPQCDNNVTLNFAEILTDIQKAAFEFRADSAGITAYLRNNVDVQSIAVPESLGLGYDITTLVISEYTSAEINLSKKIQHIGWMIYGTTQIITLNYTGTLEEFTNNVQIDTEYNTCNVEVKDCNGDVQRFKGSNLFFVNVDVFGTEQEYSVCLYGESNTRLLDATNNDCAYFLIDEDGLAYKVRIEYNDITGNRELVARFRASSNYTLVKHTATLLSADNGEEELPEEPKYPDEPIQKEIEKETFTLTAENYNLSVTAGFLREDLNDSGKAYVLGLTGQINGQNINFNYKYETPLYTNYPEIYKVFTITTGEGRTLPYNLHLVYDNDGLHVKSLKRADLMENVKIHIGNQTITQDFFRNDRYYFTDEQLPKGDWDYKYVDCYGNGDSRLLDLYSENGQYYLDVQSTEYYVVRVSVGEYTYRFTDENYDITLVLEIAHNTVVTDERLFDPDTPDYIINELYQAMPEWERSVWDWYTEGSISREEFLQEIEYENHCRIYRKSISGNLYGNTFEEIFDDEPEYFAERCYLYIENIGNYNICFYYYADGLDVKIGIKSIVFER